MLEVHFGVWRENTLPHGGGVGWGLQHHVYSLGIITNRPKYSQAEGLREGL